MKCCIIITSQTKTNKYIPAIKHELEANWPGHPRVYWASRSDPGASPSIVVEEPEFVPFFLSALSKLRDREQNISHVFHLVEDMCPLAPLPEIVNHYIEGGLADNLAQLVFPTYSDHLKTGKNVQRGYGRLIEVEPTFPYFFQLQPALWRIEYLCEILEQSIKADVKDPWGFEKLKFRWGEPHYLAHLSWPTGFLGFLSGGRIQLDALKRLREGGDSPLCRQLLQEKFGPTWPLAYPLACVVNPISRVLRPKLGAIRKWLHVSPGY